MKLDKALMFAFTVTAVRDVAQDISTANAAKNPHGSCP
jgi:hypothetical protein